MDQGSSPTAWAYRARAASAAAFLLLRPARALSPYGRPASMRPAIPCSGRSRWRCFQRNSAGRSSVLSARYQRKYRYRVTAHDDCRAFPGVVATARCASASALLGLANRGFVIPAAAVFGAGVMGRAQVRDLLRVRRLSGLVRARFDRKLINLGSLAARAVGHFPVPLDEQNPQTRRFMWVAVHCLNSLPTKKLQLH